MRVKNDHRSEFSNLSNWKEEAWKNQGFNGIQTCDLRVGHGFEVTFAHVVYTEVSNKMPNEAFFGNRWSLGAKDNIFI